ncbi:MAG: hypothetical protein LC775_04980, partial [Acidobacteria bacterium]|nr:hypothetical protein [Acidobacteriota bacterium]
YYMCGSHESIRRRPMFDLVTAVNEVANYIAYYDGMLKSWLATIHDALKPGGALLFDITTPNAKNRLVPDARCASMSVDVYFAF